MREQRKAERYVRILELVRELHREENPRLADTKARLDAAMGEKVDLKTVARAVREAGLRALEGRPPKAMSAAEVEVKPHTRPRRPQRVRGPGGRYGGA